jgi:undecaprenyl-diphosphatase
VIVAWVLLLALAVALTVLAAVNDTFPGDVRITSWIQDRPVPGQGLSEVVRELTGTEVVVVTGAVVALILWLRGYRRQAVVLVIGLALLPVLQYAIKELVDRPRPDPDLVDPRAGYRSPSFPSGHVFSATYLYGFLIYFAIALPMASAARATLVAVSVFIVALTGPTNVYLGIHWPSDVLGSLVWCAVLLFPLLVADRLLSAGGDGSLS